MANLDTILSLTCRADDYFDAYISTTPNLNGATHILAGSYKSLYSTKYILDNKISTYYLLIYARDTASTMWYFETTDISLNTNNYKFLLSNAQNVGNNIDHWRVSSNGWKNTLEEYNTPVYVGPNKYTSLAIWGPINKPYSNAYFVTPIVRNLVPYTKCLKIKKNDNSIQKIPLYEQSGLLPPLLPVKDIESNKVIYAMLGDISDPTASALRIKQNGIIYAALLYPPGSLKLGTFMLNGLTFGDGGSFPNTVHNLGRISLPDSMRLKIELSYYYTANEPKGGSAGVGIMIDNNLVVSSIKSASAWSNTYYEEVIADIPAGDHTVKLCGFKPRWHGMTSSSGYVKITISA